MVLKRFLLPGSDLFMKALSSSTCSVCRESAASRLVHLLRPSQGFITLTHLRLHHLQLYTHTHTCSGWLQKWSACKATMQQKKVIHSAKGLMNCNTKVLYYDVSSRNSHGALIFTETMITMALCPKSIPGVPCICLGFYIQKNTMVWFSCQNTR